MNFVAMLPRNCCYLNGSLLCSKSPAFAVATSNYATKLEKKKGIDRKPTPKIDATALSIASKGFLRPHKSYSPPANVTETLNELFASHNIQDDLGDKKFTILMEAATKFNHSVPNSRLHEIKTAADVKAFYMNEIITETPWDQLVKMELPPNLHLQPDYHRWKPEHGISAFPESKTLVTGLKYRNKYS